MNIANLYRKLKQILDDSNVALVNKGLFKVNNLFQIPSEIEKLDEINRLPYIFRNEIFEITEEDIGNATKISDYSLQHCTNLTNITIPNTVTYIGFLSLAANSLTDIYLYSTTPPTLYNKNAISSKTIIHVPIGSGNSYKTATNWSAHSSNIVEDINI